VWQKAGAVATVALTNPRSADVPWERTSAARLLQQMVLPGETEVARLAVAVNPAYADKFLEGSGHSFEELIGLSEAGKPLPRFPIPETLEATVQVEKADVDSQNVMAVYPGSDKNLRHEYVMLSAHLDHLGRGAPRNFRAGRAER
jgi:hypothetical protein